MKQERGRYTKNYKTKTIMMMLLTKAREEIIQKRLAGELKVGSPNALQDGPKPIYCMWLTGHHKIMPS